MSDAIVANGLMKRFGDVVALDGLDLAVPEGSVLGLLGPNGAGKTTAVSILTTLLEPDGGTAIVAGADVVREPHRVRERIGLSGQYAAVDEVLTGFENLEMIGRLYRLGRRRARRRAEELLERFDLTDAAARPVKTYSGGMRRRLDLAGALVAEPPVIFLDEPTTGLDPRSRLGLWEVIRDLVTQGTTVLLTTQYLEEADQLADEILVIDHGTAIARGTAEELKSRVGGERLDLTLARDEQFEAALGVIRSVASGEVEIERDERRLVAAVESGTAALVRVLRELDELGVELVDLSVRRPTLDDVFLVLTGHVAAPHVTEDEQVGTGQPGTKGGKR